MGFCLCAIHWHVVLLCATFFLEMGVCQHVCYTLKCGSTGLSHFPVEILFTVYTTGKVRVPVFHEPMGCFLNVSQLSLKVECSLCVTFTYGGFSFLCLTFTNRGVMSVFPIYPWCPPSVSHLSLEASPLCVTSTQGEFALYLCYIFSWTCPFCVCHTYCRGYCPLRNIYARRCPLRASHLPIKMLTSHGDVVLYVCHIYAWWCPLRRWHLPMTTHGCVVLSVLHLSTETFPFMCVTFTHVDVILYQCHIYPCRCLLCMSQLLMGKFSLWVSHLLMRKFSFMYVTFSHGKVSFMCVTFTYGNVFFYQFHIYSWRFFTPSLSHLLIEMGIFMCVIFTRGNVVLSVLH